MDWGGGAYIFVSERMEILQLPRVTERSRDMNRGSHISEQGIVSQMIGMNSAGRGMQKFHCQEE